MPSRRDALKAAALVVIPTALAQQQHEHAETPIAPRPPAKPKSLSPDEFAAVTRISDLIIPRTDTPGASDAGVPMLIDRAASQSSTLRELLHEGATAFDEMARTSHSGGFVSLTEEQQTKLLTWAEENAATPQGEFFRLMKSMTIDMYYSTPEGLKQELGWHGNTYLSEFKGCTHPEHQES
jgi:gluconate 2-dehydrogenase gamma chain